MARNPPRTAAGLPAERQAAMRPVIGTLLYVTTTDDDVRRRARNAILLALGIATLNLLVLPLILSRPTAVALLSDLLSLAANIAVIIIARSGRATLAGSLLLGFSILTLFGAALANGVADMVL